MPTADLSRDIIEVAHMRYVFRCIADREPRGGSHVYDPIGNRHFAVKNLGWLLRHSDEVFDFYVRTFKLTRGHNVNYDVILAARLHGARVYVTEFADRTVLKGWLDRPSFQGCTVNWGHHYYTIGSRDYYELAT